MSASVINDARRNIEVTFDGGRRMLSDDLREHAQRRLPFALRRFQDQIRNVRLWFEDVNGPRRGIDEATRRIAAPQ